MPSPKVRGQEAFHNFLSADFLKRQKADGAPSAFPQHNKLLKLSSRASFDQLLQCRISICLGDPFFDVLRSAVNQVFGFLQA